MKNKRNVCCSLLILLMGVIYFPVQAEPKQDTQEVTYQLDVNKSKLFWKAPKNRHNGFILFGKADTLSENQAVMTSYGPKGITRNIIQDRKGNIWIASWEGIFKYDGKSFTNMISRVSSARFFSVLQDRKGNFWFGSIGSGIYYYDGKSFWNYTTKQGLPHNDVTCIYEDKTGKIWFGTAGGASCYDGKFFRNYTTKEGLPSNGVNAILQDKTGKFWFGTKGSACVYDGKTFTVLTNHNARTFPVSTKKGSNPFMNVRSITQDRKGNIWLGGADGLWRYDGGTFTNFTQDFTGYVYKDKSGNIWTSSQSAYKNRTIWTNLQNAYKQGWVLSRYDKKTLSNKKPTVTEIKAIVGMICGILEADDGSIWFGTFNGLYRYDGNTFNDFKGKEGQ